MTRSPRTTTTLAALAALAGLIAAVAQPASARVSHSRQPCANAGMTVTASDRGAAIAAVVCLINRQRTSRGLPALRVSAALDRSAQEWSTEMVADNDFTHGADFGARISAAGFDWSTAGENIATGFTTPVSVVDGWMASTGHCQNILSPQFAFVGTGVALAGIRSVGTGSATWTQDFALPARWRAPSRNSGPANHCPYTA